MLFVAVGVYAGVVVVCVCWWCCLRVCVCLLLFVRVAVECCC